MNATTPWTGATILALAIAGCQQPSKTAAKPATQQAAPAKTTAPKPTVAQKPAASSASSAAGLRWDVPTEWKTQAPRAMRVATYTLPRAEGDSEDGECAVYYFGPGQGGSVDANIKRWIGQMRSSEGGPADQFAKRKDSEVAGISVSQVDIEGTFLYSPSPMSPQKTPKENYRMIAVIATGSQGPVFFKMTAPSKTATAHLERVEKLIASLKKI